MKGFLKKYRVAITVVVCVILANVLVQLRVFRWDMTDDRVYSLSEASKELLRKTDAPIEVTLLLDGELSPGFRRLRKAAEETLEEMRVYAHGLKITYLNVNEADAETRRKIEEQGMLPARNTTRERSGKTVEIRTYPYAILHYKGDSTAINLYKGVGQTADEVLNASIEQLEYNFMEPLHLMQRTEVPSVAILEGHDEPDERYTYDLEESLSRYFRVDRGSINGDTVDLHILDGYKAIIVANPQASFGDVERFIIDQYIMRGGTVLWAVDGVRFSTEMLQSDGYTPIIEHEIGIQDMLFRYGIRINPALVQDVQCLTIPVQASGSAQQSSVQIPWTYAPLLLTNQYHPITRNLNPVMSTFVSPIDAVGGDDGISKTILLGTSTATKITGTPNEVNLNETNPDWNTFEYQYVPVGVALEGAFPSAYAHRMKPEGVISDEAIRKQGVVSRQVVIGTGSILMNEAQRNQVLPMGYDRYANRMYSNRDFVVNAVLWLTDNDGLIRLREKSVPLRMLNTKRSYEKRTNVQLVSTLCPIILLALIGGSVTIIRKRKYASNV